MILNRDDHPHARCHYGEEDGLIHVFDMMGMAWCEDDNITDSGTVDNEPNPGDWPWCDDCLDSAREEGLVEG